MATEIKKLDDFNNELGTPVGEALSFKLNANEPTSENIDYRISSDELEAIQKVSDNHSEVLDENVVKSFNSTDNTSEKICAFKDSGGGVLVPKLVDKSSIGGTPTLIEDGTDFLIPNSGDYTWNFSNFDYEAGKYYELIASFNFLVSGATSLETDSISPRYFGMPSSAVNRRTSLPHLGGLSGTEFGTVKQIIKATSTGSFANNFSINNNTGVSMQVSNLIFIVKKIN